MRKFIQTELLEQKIAALRIQSQQELWELKEQIAVVKDSLKPSNIIHEGINEFYQTVTNKENLFSTVMSLVGGYVSKKVVVGSSNNPIKKVIGTVLQFVVTNYLSNINSKEESKIESQI